MASARKRLSRNSDTASCPSRKGKYDICHPPFVKTFSTLASLPLLCLAIQRSNVTAAFCENIAPHCRNAQQDLERSVQSSLGKNQTSLHKGMVSTVWRLVFLVEPFFLLRRTHASSESSLHNVQPHRLSGYEFARCSEELSSDGGKYGIPLTLCRMSVRLPASSCFLPCLVAL